MSSRQRSEGPGCYNNNNNKEAPWGFTSEDGKDFRPLDLLLFNWLSGKDACVDVTGGSPFAGTGVSSWAPRAFLANVAERKRKKYSANASEEKLFKYHPRCKTIKLHHLCFADDLMLFCKDEIPSVRSLAACLHMFSKSSGCLQMLESQLCMLLWLVLDHKGDHRSSSSSVSPWFSSFHLPGGPFIS